jgi:hypothetical protein
MKADLHISPYVLMSIILLIIVIVFFVNFLFVQKVQAGSYIPPKESVVCKTNSDCRNNGICLSINNKPSFCGCLEDLDCGGRSCIYNRCS